MASIVKRVIDNKLVPPGSSPAFLKENVHYEVIMGSYAYGLNNDESDTDIYGFCIPPKDQIFPHLAGEIPGFGTQVNRFEQWQIHHIKDEEKKKEYDLSIYNIVKYFDLCMGCNPNMIDSLFVPQRCVIHITPIGQLVRDNKKLFLHKKAWHTYKGYAYAQSKKMQAKHTEAVDLWEFEEENKLPHNYNSDNIFDVYEEHHSKLFTESHEPTTIAIRWKQLIEKYESSDLTKRLIDTRKYGYSTKFAYHIVRLLNEVQQILEEGDLDLERSREQLKSIRRGEWSREQILEHFSEREKQLEEVYNKSTIPYGPDESKIKALLLNCLEMHYGNLDNCLKTSDIKYDTLLLELQSLVDKYR